MSETNSGESVQSDVVESTTTDQSEVQVNRSAEDYAKRLVEVSAENKKFREVNSKLKKQLDEVVSKVSAIEEAKLQDQGKWQEVATKLKKELDETKTKANKQVESYVLSTATSHLKAAAAASGCRKLDSLVKLATADGLLGELEVDEKFNVSEESIKSVLEKAQKEYADLGLFGKPAPSVKDTVPMTKPESVTAGEGLSLEQKSRKLAELLAQQ